MACECACNEAEALRCRAETEALKTTTGTALVPTTSTALAIFDEKEKNLRAEIARADKAYDRFFLKGTISLIGGAAAALIVGICFNPAVGGGILVAGIAGVVFNMHRSEEPIKKILSARKELAEITDARASEQQKIADGARAAHASRIRLAAKAVLDGLPETENLVAGKSVIGFQDPDDSTRTLMLRVTEITDYRDAGAATARERVVARVHHHTPRDNHEIAQSPEIEGVGAISVTRALPIAFVPPLLPLPPRVNPGAATP